MREVLSRVLASGRRISVSWRPLREVLSRVLASGRRILASWRPLGASGTGFWLPGALWEGPGGPIWVLEG